MDLYLDDCACSHRLTSALEAVGHRVHIPASVGLAGADDHLHLSKAAERGWTLVTRNPDDFLNLHAAWQRRGRRHSGILLIYQDNIRGKDMQPSDVVRAIANLVSAGVTIENEVQTLNHWRFG